MTMLDSLLSAIGGAPALPGARCRHRSHLFDERGGDEPEDVAEQRHQQGADLLGLSECVIEGDRARDDFGGKVRLEIEDNSAFLEPLRPAANNGFVIISNLDAPPPPAAVLPPALGLCKVCPALAGCSEWFDALPARKRPTGVVAGIVNSPKKEGTSA